MSSPIGRLAGAVAASLIIEMTAAAPTGLNVIPTTDIVPLGNWILGLQNGNPSFTGINFYQRPQPALQFQMSTQPGVEFGIDYAQTPDFAQNTAVFNAKALVLNENDWEPNVAIGFWNVAFHQKPAYYVVASKTLNYEQEQEERFRAHHRRNRKMLGRRVHVGLTLDGHGNYQPLLGTDWQLSETFVFQADWIHGSGNAATAGFAYVFPDQRTVLVPSLLFSNDSHRFSGISLNLNHQFNL